MILLLSSQSFPHYSLDRVFSFAKKAGYDAMEIQINANFDSQDAEYLKTLEKRHDIPIKSFSLPDMISKELLKSFQDTVKEFPNAMLNLAPPQSFSFTYKKWFELIAPKLLQKYDLRLNLRNMPLNLILGMIPSNSENSLHLLREQGSVCLDVSAIWSSKQDLMKAVTFLGESLKCVYLSNVNKNVPYERLESGVLPLESFLTKLAQRGYHGAFVVHLSPKAMGEGDIKKINEVLIDSKMFIEKYFR